MGEVFFRNNRDFWGERAKPLHNMLVGGLVGGGQRAVILLKTQIHPLTTQGHDLFTGLNGEAVERGQEIVRVRVHFVALQLAFRGCFEYGRNILKK